jgi:hypothetical protein
MAWMILWMLLLSSGFFQDAVGCTNDTCHEDNALVQLPKSQSSTTTTTLPGRWVLGAQGSNFGYSWFIIILSMFISWEPRAESGRTYTYIDIIYIYICLDHGPSSQQNTPSYVMFLGKVSSFFFVKMFCKISALRTPCQEFLHKAAMMLVKQCRARAT